MCIPASFVVTPLVVYIRMQTALYNNIWPEPIFHIESENDVTLHILPPESTTVPICDLVSTSPFIQYNDFYMNVCETNAYMPHERLYGDAPCHHMLNTWHRV